MVRKRRMRSTADEIDDNQFIKTEKKNNTSPTFGSLFHNAS